MRFEAVRYPHQSHCDEIPRVKLVRVDWDDFGYSTLFDAYLVRRPGQRELLGQVKILRRGVKRTVLPESFELLDSHHATVGQSSSFYEAVEQLDRMGVGILAGLRDVTVEPLTPEVEADPGYRNSLLRSPRAQLAYDRRMQENLETTVEFRWHPRFKIHGSDGIDFAFDVGKPFGRIIVLIGENAAGKTHALARLALALSGARREGEVSPTPGLARVLAVSFSAFDDFPIPKWDDALYDYSGLRNFDFSNPWQNRGRVDVERAYTLLKEQRRILVEKGRVQEWRDVLTCAGVSPEKVEFDLELSSALAERNSTLSAGQTCVAFVFTNLVAKLQPRSLVLFDEPELHTHPRMLSGVMRGLSRLLDQYDSFAILSTHSPIVLQEIPARSVRIFERLGEDLEDSIMISAYPRESFGAPLDEIERFAFRIDAEERNFQQRLEELAATGRLSREDIEAVLQEPISLSTRVLLERFTSRSQ